jgi:ABC-2 type transport system permease protein
MFYNPELKSVYMFVPGLIALILMLVSALMTSIAITKEKEFGSMEVLLVSPLKPQIIILGKVVPYITIALINSLSVLTLALLIFKVPFKGSFLIFLGESFLFILTALSLGIMISTIAKTQQVALMMSLAGLLMPTVLLSGFIFPIENMPAVLQYLSHLIPAKWFLVILKSNMLKGNGIEYYWKETLILFLMMTFYLLISVKKFKIRLE